MTEERRRAITNWAGDALIAVGFALLIWGIWSWSEPLALVAGGVGLISVGTLAALK